MALPFDTHQRLGLIKTFALHLLRESPGNDRRRARVLDVGGFPGLLAEQISAELDVVTLDRPPGAGPGYVRGSGLALPVGARAFDAVVASDVLEHIAPGARQTFVEEMLRASAGWVLLGGPFHSSAVEQAEALVNELNRLVGGQPNAWLDEHWQAGLPDLAYTRRHMARVGWASIVVPNGSLFSWFLLMELQMALHAVPDGFAQFQGFNDFYVNQWSTCDHRRPTYRHLVLAHRDPQRLADLMASPPPIEGLEFFGVDAEAPLTGRDEARRLRSLAVQIERLVMVLKAQASSGASIDAGYTARLERIVEEQEQQRLRLERRVAELEKDAAERNRGAFWRILRSLRGRPEEPSQ